MFHINFETKNDYKKILQNNIMYIGVIVMLISQAICAKSEENKDNVANLIEEGNRYANMINELFRTSNLLPTEDTKKPAGSN